MGPNVGMVWEGVDKRLPHATATVLRRNDELHRLPIARGDTHDLVPFRGE